MAGLAAASRLSEPGWQHRFGSITVHQRGWRLGGKGASSRGPNGRIEEHGLHIWLGAYENAFGLVRECYAELDRARTDPTAPIRSWDEAFIPAPVVGIEERDGDGWRRWLATFGGNDELPGEPGRPGEPLTAAGLAARFLLLLRDFTDSHPNGLAALPMGTLAAVGEAAVTFPRPATVESIAAIDEALAAVSDAFATAAADDPALLHSWDFVALAIATVRGLVVDGALRDPRGLRALNGEDFRSWVARHGASPETVDSALLTGLHDLAFAHQDGDPDRGSFEAGWGLVMWCTTLLNYRGSIFWKMTAGMGDVVFAPLYEALRRRGVDFEFFHRVDGLHLAPDRSTVDAVSIGVQARPAGGAARYEPLVRVGGLPCFPAAPLVDQLHDADGIESQPLESHWCTWPDAEQRVLRRGVDFDHLVYAIPPGMTPTLCRELIADRPEWRDMVANVRTVATQALQLWLREDEAALGWEHPGVTTTGYVKPFETWASMPQLLGAEGWPAEDAPRAIAYFCSTLADEPLPEDPADWPAHAGRETARVRDHAVRFLTDDVAHLLPGAVRDGEFRWNLLCGRDGAAGSDAIDSQHYAANIDRSDRYVQAVAGSDRHRLRPDESGYDNLALAGDWTDCGYNAGCIEAAVLSGLEAATAVLGRPRFHRVTGTYVP